jgi:Domain of unknown function (DUF6265)
MGLKHFHSDLKGWEEKDAVRAFPLIKIAPGEIYFDGMAYKKTGQGTLVVHLAREVVFEYRRKPCNARRWECLPRHSNAAITLHGTRKQAGFAVSS